MKKTAPKKKAKKPDTVADSIRAEIKSGKPRNVAVASVMSKAGLIKQ